MLQRSLEMTVWRVCLPPYALIVTDTSNNHNMEELTELSHESQVVLSLHPISV